MSDNPALRVWDIACNRCVPLIDKLIPPANNEKMQIAFKIFDIMSRGAMHLVDEIESLEKERDKLAQELLRRL